MGQIADTILGAARISRRNAELLLVGIDPARAAMKPRGESGRVIDTNHPTFVYGHLCLYPPRLMALLARDATAITPPSAWEPLFKAGAACQDDLAGTIYPSFGTVSSHLLRATDVAIDALAHADDALLAKPNPNEASRDRFPTIGAVACFYLTGHMMVHLGQVSAWRRCMGLPSAM
ncbi:MAG: hypothetical protein HBSAPP03_20590 [Phycisphaerae bacterium]|nr:MAG: hypothetical protein HBSAPP03_20590 [Phycisphaerae bacterium]